MCVCGGIYIAWFGWYYHSALWQTCHSLWCPRKKCSEWKRCNRLWMHRFPWSLPRRKARWAPSKFGRTIRNSLYSLLSLSPFSSFTMESSKSRNTGDHSIPWGRHEEAFEGHRWPRSDCQHGTSFGVSTLFFAYWESLPLFPRVRLWKFIWCPSSVFF